MQSRTRFTALKLRPELCKSLETLGFQNMTPIQEQSLPHILKNQDVIAKAKTGSGKTLAFGIGLLEKIQLSNPNIQALVICPTRELADQVAKEIRSLAKHLPNLKMVCLYGGRSVRSQMPALQNVPHIVVGTPGRLKDHLNRQTINMNHLKILVLDEADRMLDMGFSEEIFEIASLLPRQRQTLLFSATFPETIQEVSSSIQHKPIQIAVESVHSEVKIEQIFFKVDGESHKLEAVRKLLSHHRPSSLLIFCNTKIQCQEIATALQKAGVRALAIHGDLEQHEREEVLMLFANKSCSILVATDVASRGLHIDELPMVINYELPKQPETYVHRIGRTGRAGESGQAFSLFSPQERRRVEAIEEYLNQPTVHGDLAQLRTTTKADITDTAAPMATLRISGGRKNKLSKGDILGALTSQGSPILGSHVGKIDIFDFHACVAIALNQSEKALELLEQRTIKGKSYKVKIL